MKVKQVAIDLLASYSISIIYNVPAAGTRLPLYERELVKIHHNGLVRMYLVLGRTSFLTIFSFSVAVKTRTYRVVATSKRVL